MMLAHAASTQGISAIENIVGRSHAVDHEALPAACFTHPEIAMVGLTEEQAVERSEKEGWKLGERKRTEGLGEKRPWFCDDISSQRWLML